MAKNKPAVKTTKSATPEVAPEKISNKRGAVLIQKTASQLHDLIGDTPIGVSRKELKAAILNARAEEALAGTGL